MGVGYCGFGDEVWTEGFCGLILRASRVLMYQIRSIECGLRNLQNKNGYLCVFV